MLKRVLWALFLAFSVVMVKPCSQWLGIYNLGKFVTTLGVGLLVLLIKSLVKDRGRDLKWLDFG